MNKLFRWSSDCGRMGSLDGLFIATQAEVDAIIGKEVYFGEVLGKHSEIAGDIEASEFEVICTDKTMIDNLLLIFQGKKTLCGYNPLDYYEEEGE